MAFAETRVCPRCKRDLPLTNEYYHNNRSRSDGFACHCKDCEKDRREKNRDRNNFLKREWNKKNKLKNDQLKQLAVDYLGGRCECCGATGPLSILQFHHLDPSIKLGGWQWMTKNTEQVRTAELDKCSLLCANCHVAYHNGDVQYNEWSGYKWKEPLEYKYRTVA